jgi:hypothetical protein
MPEKSAPKVGMNVFWAKPNENAGDSEISWFAKLAKDFGSGPFTIRTTNLLGPNNWNITLTYLDGSPVVQVWDWNTEQPPNWKPSIKYFILAGVNLYLPYR